MAIFNYSNYHNRSSSGASLIMVASIAFCVSIWLYTAMATVLPVYQHASSSRLKAILNEAAESALDEVVADLNTACQSGTSSNYDDAQEDAEPVCNEIKNQDYEKWGVKVTVSVLNKRPPKNSWMYNRQLDPQESALTNIHIDRNGWRILTATARASHLTKSIRCVLEPAYSPVSVNGSTGTVAPYFRYGIAATGSIRFSGPVVKEQPYSSFALQSGHREAFQHQKANAPIPSLPAQAYPPVLSPCPNDQAVSGQLSISHEARSTAPGPNEIVRLGSLDIPEKTSLILAWGDYEITELHLGAGAQIKPLSRSMVDHPIRLFIKGRSSNRDVISLASGSTVNASDIPANFQIWYAGSRNIVIYDNASLSGVIYAPNADITTASTIHGAIVGHNLFLAGGGVCYDLDLQREPSLQFPVDLATPIDCRLVSLRPVTWQEL